MKIILWISSLFLIALSSYFIIMNWAVFFNNYVFKKRWTSAVPLVGGVLGAAGLALLPISNIDWGSLPVLIASLILYYFKK
jgi:hypothetical protein